MPHANLTCILASPLDIRARKPTDAFCGAPRKTARPGRAQGRGDRGDRGESKARERSVRWFESTCDFFKIDGGCVDFAGGGHVGPRAQVPPVLAASLRLTDVVDGDGGFRVLLPDTLKDLQLVRLPDLFYAPLGLLWTDLRQGRRQAEEDDAAPNKGAPKHHCHEVGQR